MSTLAQLPAREELVHRRRASFPGTPVMVQVLPDPVWPCAKMALNPSRTDSIIASVSSNTSFVESGPKTLSNVYCLRTRRAARLLYRRRQHLRSTESVVRSAMVTACLQPFSFSYAAKGRQRAKPGFCP